MINLNQAIIYLLGRDLFHILPCGWYSTSYADKSRRAVSRTECQVESWFWSHFPFSGLGIHNSFHIPVKRQLKSPWSDTQWLGFLQEACNLAFTVPLSISSQNPCDRSQHKARSFWSLLLTALGTSSASHLLSFPQLIKNKVLPVQEPRVLSLCCPAICFVLGVRGRSSACTAQLDLLM